MTRFIDDRGGLYAIVDPEHCGARAPEAVAEAILEGGCAVLQLRAKSLGDAAHLALADRVARLCRMSGVPFVINDRPDIAVLVEADGVHVGQDDLPPSAVRSVVPDRMVVGVSTHDLDQATRAPLAGADYIGFGPVFATRSKAAADPVVGLEGLRAAVARVDVPVVAIGGITEANVAEVYATGARYVAVIGALSGAADIAAAARRLHATRANPVERCARATRANPKAGS
jgi:thiamine-phosphate pyrophosphorylase